MIHLSFILLLFIFSANICLGKIVQAYAADDLVDSIGINTHLTFTNTLYYENYSFVKSSLIDLGIRHIRDGGVTQEFREKVIELYDNGIDTQLVLELGWDLFGDSSHCKTIYPCTDIVTYINSFFGAVPSVEGPNENDLTSQRVSLNYLNFAGFPNATREFSIENYKAIKTGQTTKNLLVGSPSIGYAPDSYQISPFYDFMDLIVFHPYAGGQAPSQQGLDTWWMYYSSQMAGNNRTKPFQASECGYHTLAGNTNGDQAGVPESVQAKYMPRMWIIFFTAGLVRSYSYELLDNKNVDPTDSQEHYGIIRYDRTVKPVYNSIKNLISILGDRYTTFTPGTLDFTVAGKNTIQTTLFQKSNGDYYIAIWNEVSCYSTSTNKIINVDPVTANVTINTPIRSYKVLQVSKSSTTAIATGTQSFIQLSVPDEILFIIVTPSAQSSTTSVSNPVDVLNCNDYKTVLDWTFSERLGSFIAGSSEHVWTATSIVAMSPSHVTINNDGDVVLTLSNSGCPTDCNNVPYASGGWSSEQFYGHGNYSFTVKMPSVSGVYTMVHIYRGNPQDDIVFQFGGALKSTEVYIYYYANADYYQVGTFNLGFDFSSNFHTYTIVYGETSLAFYADNQLVASTNTSKNPVPQNDVSLRVWLMANSNGYGNFQYTGPVTAQLRKVGFVENSSLPYPPSPCIMGSADYGVAPKTSPTSTSTTGGFSTADAATTSVSTTQSLTTDSSSSMVQNTLTLCVVLAFVILF